MLRIPKSGIINRPRELDAVIRALVKQVNYFTSLTEADESATKPGPDEVAETQVEEKSKQDPAAPGGARRSGRNSSTGRNPGNRTSSRS
jgi:hypothetical protein